MIKLEWLTGEGDGTDQSNDGYIVDRSLITGHISFVNSDTSDVMILQGKLVFAMRS